MIKTRTAKKFLAAATMAAAAFTGFAGVAGADTFGPAPQPQGPVINGTISTPTTQPQPDPPAPEPELPIAQPEPGVDPSPDLPIANPEPEPFEPPIAQPQPEPQPQPEGPDEITDVPDCTHGCGGDDGTIDDITSAGDECEVVVGGPVVCPGDEPEDTPEETPGDEPGDEPTDEPTDEPKDGGEGRGDLPRTGAGILALAGLGTALTAGGVAAKKAAKRS